MKRELSETIKIGGKEMELQETRAMIAQYKEVDFIYAIDFISCVLVHADKVKQIDEERNLYKINSFQIQLCPKDIKKFKRIASFFIRGAEKGYNLKIKI